MCQWCARFFWREFRLARKTGQIVGRGRSRWLVRVFLGHDRETPKRRYHSRIVRGPVRHAQHYLNKVLRERDLGRQVDGGDVTLNECLDRWLEIAAAPRLREKATAATKTCFTIFRPSLGPRNLVAICPLISRPRISNWSSAVCRREPSGTHTPCFVQPCGRRFDGGSWPRIRPTLLSCRDCEGAKYTRLRNNRGCF